MTAIELPPKDPKKMKALSGKKAKNEKRKREDYSSSNADDDHDNDENATGQETKDAKRSKKRHEKEALLAQVPEANAHGIAYTKLQRRRMMKRVKRGLPPVPTPEEEAERLKQEAQLKREEEEELAGMLYNRVDEKEIGHEDADAEDDEEGDDEKPIQEDHDDDLDEETETKPDITSELAKKKKARVKQVPADYICQACQNKREPIHWIYDCPDKVTIRGTNNVSKSNKGIHDPDDKKVFVSGLPFEAKRNDVDVLFASCGKLVHCKLLTFPDTGRCKGQAYLTFDTIESAKKAVALNGTTIDAMTTSSSNKNDTSQKAHAGKARTELKLKVSKMLNRVATKKHNGPSTR